jgi:hypothetical protein
MHRRKDGKVIASLTEVKNKTGDIFSLVDEFGEVLLTSYNKPRYRITKIGVADILDLEEKKPSLSTESKPEVEKPKSVFHKVKNTVSNLTKPVKKAEPEVEPIANKGEESSMIEKTMQFEKWDSNSKSENDYIKKVLNPLQ